MPISPYTLGAIDPHDPSNWMTCENAYIIATNFGPGYMPGFVFTEHDPFFFLDIDKCLQSDGQWSPIAQEMLNRFRGAYIEVSQSGNGLHIIGSYEGRLPPHRCKNKEYGMELYTEKRFVALTVNMMASQ